MGFLSKLIRRVPKTEDQPCTDECKTSTGPQEENAEQAKHLMIYFSRKFRLVNTQNNTYGLTPLGITSFGSADDNVHTFSNDPSIADYHFEIFCSSKGYELYSSPKVSDERSIVAVKRADDTDFSPVQGRHLLCEGDLIRAGSQVFLYSCAETA